MSEGIGFTTILGCLEAGEKVAKLEPTGWKPGRSSSGAYSFLEMQDHWRKGLAFFDSEKLRSFATFVRKEVSEKAVEWKMRIDEIPDGGPGSVYMISQLREMLSWQQKGVRVNRDWPEFVLKKGVSFYNIGVSDGVVVNVQLEGLDQVYMTTFSSSLDGLNLYQMIRQIESVLVPAPSIGYESVQVPCVSADIEANVKWLVGMTNGNYQIAYAQQKILFGMNEVGFAVREETGMMMRETCIRPSIPYILSPNGESFLFWRRRAGVDFPVSMFLFTKDDFKDPGDISKIVE